MKIMSEGNLRAQLEALLFCHGEPVSFKKITSFLEVKEASVREAAREMMVQLNDDEDRGLALVILDESLQLVTKPVFSFIMEKLVKEDLKEDLTPAALETLAIVAYLQPITRAEIDYLRGVNSTFTLRALLLRGLIRRSEERGAKGTYNYSVSFDFLKHIGITKPEEMPEYDKYKGFLDNIRKAEVNRKNS